MKTTPPYVYHFKRFYTPGSIPVESIEVALDRAEHDVDYETAAPMRVTDASGKVVLDREAIFQCLWEMDTDE